MEKTMFEFKPQINKKSEKIIKEKSMIYDFMSSPKLEEEDEKTEHSKAMLSSASLNRSGIVTGNKFRDLYEDAR